ncbi:MAG: ATP-dependent DNA helicase RecG [Anaerolineae bacterium]
MTTESALTRLLKILALEKKQGYRNKAVIGGLDKFVSRWDADARAELGSPENVSQIVALLLGYAVIEEPAARQRIIEEVERRARELSGPPPSAGQIQPPPPQAPEPTTAAKAAPHPPAATVEEKPRSRGPEAFGPAPSKPVAAPDSELPSSVRPAEPPAPEPEPADRPAIAPRPTLPGTGLDAPITRLPGVGPGFAQKLNKLGVRTVRDLLYLLPRRYEDYSNLRTIAQLRWGEEVTVIGTVWDIKSRPLGEDRRLVTARVGDGTGEMEMTWFTPFVERQLRLGRAYAFSGKVDSYRGVPTMRHPAFEPLDREQVSTGRLVPVYPLTEGLSAPWLRRVMDRAVKTWAAEIPDVLPEALRREYQLLPLAQALTQIHFPDSREMLAAAHRRLSFDEFFLLQLGFLLARQRFRGTAAVPLPADAASEAAFLAALPFPLTGAQRRALGQITADLRKKQPMSRLLQGDVGSGKTAVAAAALWFAVADGKQGAIMAPTEILAEQHARSFGRLFERLRHPLKNRPVRVVLLTGSLRSAERDQALAAIAGGEADIVVGTHALIQRGVTFRNLAVAVVDEQHRFGVEQRAALRQRNFAGSSQPIQPHMLVMSATPIPRSLALTIYGDLDISVLDEMPPGRTPIKTKWLTSAERERAYGFIRRQVQAGRQAFIIYPLVEESETSDAKAAVKEYTRLQQVIFPDLRVALLHGRMKAEEKERTMRAFVMGESDILVATAVVEVGIDVPNATVILIEDAERFGLAQLHQFRGRVGRGEHPSYCILISDAAEGDSVKRLRALENTTDGFALAQIDLELRGPGDFFGTRQSGLPPLHTAELSDLRTLEEARHAAQKLFAADPGLSRPEHHGLASRVAEFWQGAGDLS